MFEDSGHCPFLEETEKFNGAVQRVHGSARSRGGLEPRHGRTLRDGRRSSPAPAAAWAWRSRGNWPRGRGGVAVDLKDRPRDLPGGCVYLQGDVTDAGAARPGRRSRPPRPRRSRLPGQRGRGGLVRPRLLGGGHRRRDLEPGAGDQPHRGHALRPGQRAGAARAPRRHGPHRQHRRPARDGRADGRLPGLQGRPDQPVARPGPGPGRRRRALQHHLPRHGRHAAGRRGSTPRIRGGASG